MILMTGPNFAIEGEKMALDSADMNGACGCVPKLFIKTGG